MISICGSSNMGVWHSIESCTTNINLGNCQSSGGASQFWLCKRLDSSWLLQLPYHQLINWQTTSKFRPVIKGRYASLQNWWSSTFESQHKILLSFYGWWSRIKLLTKMKSNDQGNILVIKFWSIGSMEVTTPLSYGQITFPVYWERKKGLVQLQ